MNWKWNNVLLGNVNTYVLYLRKTTEISQLSRWLSDIGRFYRCWATKLRIVAELNLQSRGRSHWVTVGCRAEVGTPCVSVLLRLLLPSLSLAVSVIWSVRDFGTDRLPGTFIVTENSFRILWRLCLVSARIHLPGPNADQWRPVPSAAVGPIIMEGNRSICEPVAVLPLPSIDSIYQWSNTLLKKNYCLVSRLV